MTTPSWKDWLKRAARDVRDDIHRVSNAAGIGSGPKPYELAVYRGYGSATRVLVHGRAMECESLPPAAATDSVWRNLISTYKRIDSDPLAFARVRATIGGVTRDLVAGDDGFFREWIDLPHPPAGRSGWAAAQLELLSPLRENQRDVRATAQIRVPALASTFGVISDLDDTVIQSRIANFLVAVRTVMLGNARTRLPFPGVAAFYQALERGGDGAHHNPIFYVSSSPWNLHDVIAEFMEIQRIPVGPIVLRDWDVSISALTSSRLRTHKAPLIREILDLYPAMPFILIGDSSQQDPEIYRAIIDAYPGRILAVYIRNVHPDPQRIAAVKALATDVLASGSSLVLADDTYAAAEHAAEHGWIATDALPAIREETRADEGKTGTKAEAPESTDGGEPAVTVE